MKKQDKKKEKKPKSVVLEAHSVKHVGASKFRHIKKKK